MGIKLPKPQLSFMLTSTVGHEQILTSEDMETILRACYYHSKGSLKKLKPFYTVCKNEHEEKIRGLKDNSVRV